MEKDRLVKLSELAVSHYTAIYKDCNNKLEELFIVSLIDNISKGNMSRRVMKDVLQESIEETLKGALDNEPSN